ARAARRAAAACRAAGQRRSAGLSARRRGAGGALRAAQGGRRADHSVRRVPVGRARTRDLPGDGSAIAPGFSVSLPSGAAPGRGAVARGDGTRRAAPYPTLLNGNLAENDST